MSFPRPSVISGNWQRRDICSILRNTGEIDDAEVASFGCGLFFCRLRMMIITVSQRNEFIRGCTSGGEIIIDVSLYLLKVTVFLCRY